MGILDCSKKIRRALGGLDAIGEYDRVELSIDRDREESLYYTYIWQYSDGGSQGHSGLWRFLFNSRWQLELEFQSCLYSNSLLCGVGC